MPILGDCPCFQVSELKGRLKKHLCLGMQQKTVEKISILDRGKLYLLQPTSKSE